MVLKFHPPQIRKALNNAFDDAEFDAFCFDYFDALYDKFSAEMRKDYKMTLLLHLCRRRPTGFEHLLNLVRQEYEMSDSQREELLPLIETLEAYLKQPQSTTAQGTTPAEVAPDFLKNLAAPGGAVSLHDKFYVERDADVHLNRQVIKVGSLTTIRAGRRTGKTSLLVRGVDYARQNGSYVVHFDMRRVDRHCLETPDRFLRYLAEYIFWQLRLDMGKVDQVWSGPLGALDKLTELLLLEVLPTSDKPLLLAMDEVDRLLETDFHTDFFALIRSWHDNRSFEPQLSKLNIVLVISTEPHLLIADVRQSPFNVGLRLELQDFSEKQVRLLNSRHNSPVREQDIPQLMELLNGHPYLTRQALYTLVTQSLDWREVSRRALTDQGPFAEHLRHCYWLLSDEPDLRAALKSVIKEENCLDEKAFYRLLRAGLVTGSSDSCTCRCGLYQRYFENKL